MHRQDNRQRFTSILTTMGNREMVELKYVKLGMVVDACKKAALYFALDYDPERDTFSLSVTRPGSHDYEISDDKDFCSVVDDFLAQMKEWDREKKSA